MPPLREVWKTTLIEGYIGHRVYAASKLAVPKLGQGVGVAGVVGANAAVVSAFGWYRAATAGCSSSGGLEFGGWGGFGCRDRGCCGCGEGWEDDRCGGFGEGPVAQCSGVFYGPYWFRRRFRGSGADRKSVV